MNRALFYRYGLGAVCLLLLLAARLAVNAAPAMPRAKSVYLFTSFHDADQKYLRFLYSEDGYRWTNVPGTFLEANVGVSREFRDPSLLLGPDGVFRLVWTAGWHGDQGFGYASSRDLIHWSPQQFIPVMTNQTTTVNVWAPELFFDSSQNHYIITWASTIPGRFPDLLEKHDNNHRIYCTVTSDFKHFSPARLFFNPGYSVIDPFEVQERGGYVLVFKDNSRTHLNIRVAYGSSPMGPWESVSKAFTPEFSEGPAVLKLGDKWLIYYDAYRKKTYGAVETRDFRRFVDVSGLVSFPSLHKHGTAIQVPKAILEGLLKASTQTAPPAP